MEHHHGLPNDQTTSYTYFQDPDPAYNLGGYPQPISQYHQVQGGPQTRPLSVDMQQQQQQGMQQYSINMVHQYQAAGFTPSPPPHVQQPITTSPSPEMYDPLSPPVSGSDTSADGIYHHNSSGQNSPSSSRANSLVHRSIRYNPTPSPTSSSGRRSRGRSHDSDDEVDMGAPYTENLAHSRKEATRRQRIEAEQRRRDELRDGYAKLKDVLPVSNQKSSKVSLLERATQHIISLEKKNQELQSRLNTLELELSRLRVLNEKISLGANDGHSPGMFEARPLSPPPDLPIPGHATAPKLDPSDDSSASEDGGF